MMAITTNNSMRVKPRLFGMALLPSLYGTWMIAQPLGW